MSKWENMAIKDRLEAKLKEISVKVSDKTYFLYHDTEATHLLIQPVDDHDLEVLDQEVAIIRNPTKIPFSLVSLLIEYWNI